jgi:phosphoenolpyruvate synthase/pyruvate phosphate dikinase
MMDTILNVGIDQATGDFWEKRLGPTCFLNSFSRLLTMYGSVVKGLDRHKLESLNVLDAQSYYKEEVGQLFPSAFDQLMGAIEAVFKSWDNERNDIYRKQEGIPREWGTAVTVQAMVFGNLNEQSCTGVLFTRNSATGEATITGEFLPNAQGEDIVAGIRTPLSLSHLSKWNPTVATDLFLKVKNLEQQKKDMQDVEFTVQDGILYLLQTRNGKRTPMAAVKIAVDLAKEGILTKVEAIKRISAKTLDLAQTPSIDASWQKKADLKGIGGSVGIGKGKPVFTSKDAIASKVPCILITQETTADDIGGMLAAKGIITMHGGFTSHAAVVARGANKPCVTGVGKDLSQFYSESVVTMDGLTGNIWLQDVPVEEPKANGAVKEFKEMVLEVTEAIPAFTEAPTANMPQGLLYLGTKMLHPAEAVKLINRTKAYVGRLYVDLTVGAHPVEQAFFSLMGAYNPAQEVVNLLEQGPIDSSIILIGHVQPKKFKMVGAVQDLRSLVLSDGEVMIGGEFDKNDPALQWVLKHKANEGLTPISVGQYTAGVKSILSPEQSLLVAQEGK